MHVSVDSNTRRRQQPLNGCSTPCWAIRAGRETGYCRLAAWPGCQCFNQRCSAGVALPVRDFLFFHRLLLIVLVHKWWRRGQRTKETFFLNQSFSRCSHCTYKQKPSAGLAVLHRGNSAPASTETASLRETTVYTYTANLQSGVKQQATAAS